MNCAYHVGVEMVPLPQAPHRHFQTAADPNEPADSARVDLRCPVKWCPCVASELTSRANKKNCKVCGKPIKEWRSHMPRTCKACHSAYTQRHARQRISARARAAVDFAARRSAAAATLQHFNPSTLPPSPEASA